MGTFPFSLKLSRMSCTESTELREGTILSHSNIWYHERRAWAMSRSTPGSLPEGLAGLNCSSPCQLVHSCVKLFWEKGGHGCEGGSRASNGMLTRSLNVLHPLSLCPLRFNCARVPDKSTVWKPAAGGKLPDTAWCWCCHVGWTWNICSTKR